MARERIRFIGGPYDGLVIKPLVHPYHDGCLYVPGALGWHRYLPTDDPERFEYDSSVSLGKIFKNPWEEPDQDPWKG